MSRSAQNACLALLLALPAFSGILPASVLIAGALLGVLAALTLRSAPVQLTRPAALALVFVACWLALVWASAFIGGLTKDFPQTSITAATRLSVASVLFLAATASFQGRLATVVQAFVLIGVLHATISLVQFLTGGSLVIGDIARSAGALTPNILANLLGFSLLCGVAVAVGLVDGVPASRMNLVFVVIIAAGMLAAGTLKNLLAVAALFTVLYLLGAKARLPLRLIGMAAATAVLLPALLMSDRIGARLSEATDVLSYFGLGSGFHVDSSRPSSLLWRVEHWAFLIRDWSHNFFWTGSGIGQSINMRGIRSIYGEGAAAHSDWVALIVEGGIVIAPLWLAAISAAIYFSFRGLRKSTNRRLFVLVTAYFVLIMLTGNVLYTSSFLYCYWLLIGALLSDRSPVPLATSPAAPFHYLPNPRA